jgi:hypothetical protein
MKPRTDLLTARRVDTALTLFPIVGWLKTSVALAAYGVPIDVAARVMTRPRARRTVDEDHVVIRTIS